VGSQQWRLSGAVWLSPTLSHVECGSLLPLFWLSDKPFGDDEQRQQAAALHSNRR
jgi:hypothetical protein